MKILPLISFKSEVFEPKKMTPNTFVRYNHVAHTDTISFGKAEENNKLTLSQTKWLISQASKFPEDINYKKALCQNLGLSPSEYYLLHSVMGAAELEDAVSSLKEENYTPGKRKHPEIIDSHDLSNMKSGKFRANLHNHSVHSDGKLTIKEMLELAVKIADNNKEKSGITTKVKNAPFILGLTDHDTVEGAKEILEIIKEDPWKYKNLKIVLGTEISAIGTLFCYQTKPISIHTLFYNLNPFDKELNRFLDSKKEGKKNLINQAIERLNQANLFEDQDIKIKFSTDELNQVYQMPSKGLGEVYIAFSKYVKAKLIFEYLNSYDDKFMQNMSKLGFEPDDFKVSDILKYQKSAKINTGKFLKFEDAYNEFINLKLKEKAEKQKKNYEPKVVISKLPNKLSTALLNASTIYNQVKPQLYNLDEAYADFDETLQFLSAQEYGTISPAHPAKLCFNNTGSGVGDFYREFYSKFKELGGEKALYNEEYYQSYDMSKSAPTFITSKFAGEEADLLPIGGTDSHGDNLWSRRKLR